MEEWARGLRLFAQNSWIVFALDITEIEFVQNVISSYRGKLRVLLNAENDGSIFIASIFLLFVVCIIVYVEHNIGRKMCRSVDNGNCTFPKDAIIDNNVFLIKERIVINRGYIDYLF